MSQDMTPSFGARFALNRRQVDAQCVIYDVTIYLPQGSRCYALHIAQADGQCQLHSAAAQPVHGAADAALPDWVHKHLQSLARGIYRAAQRQAQDGSAAESAWQRRLLRWHEEPAVTAARGRRASAAASPSDAHG